MIPRNGITMASFIVGLVGAAIGGLISFAWVSQDIGIPEYTIAIGIFSGFLSCFLVSMWYLRFMEYKGWQWGILFGPLFAALAGTISGVVTIFSSIFEDIGSPHFYLGLRAVGLFSLYIGGGTGVVVGLISHLIFGAIRAIFAEKRS